MDNASPVTHRGQEEGPACKKVKLESNDFSELDKFMSETENFFQPGCLNMELETAIASCDTGIVSGVSGGVSVVSGASNVSSVSGVSKNVSEMSENVSDASKNGSDIPGSGSGVSEDTFRAFEGVFEGAFESAFDEAKTENPTEFSASSADTSPYANLFDAIEPSESVSSEEVVNEASKAPTKSISTESVNPATLSEIKQSMASTSRLVATFTVLKGTYLKLCKEFNYLLGKFNENERIKIELIHENNQLRNLLFESIKEKELDRKKYRAGLEAARAAARKSVS